MSTQEQMYHPVEQPHELPVREKEDAMGAYLMMFGALAAGLPLPVINLIAAIVYYYVNRGKSRFVRFHSLQSLYSQIPTTLLNAVLVFWTFRILFSEGSFQDNRELFSGFASVSDLYWGYLYTVIAANVLYVVFSLVGAYKARKGQFYYFIFFGRLAYHNAYKISQKPEQLAVNKPPV